MKIKSKFFIVVLPLLFFSAILYSSESPENNDLDLLLSYMEGSFNSHEQSVNDSDYFDVRLEMKRIWLNREDGYWFYVEQAISDYLDRPYRQRVYRLYESTGKIASDIYELENSENFIGAHHDVSVFDSLNPADLIYRTGCTVYLEKFSDTEFRGGTLDDNCISTLRGAAYATTEVVIKPDMMISWDRGFNSEGEQVWGTDKGGYRFQKIK